MIYFDESDVYILHYYGFHNKKRPENRFLAATQKFFLSMTYWTMVMWWSDNLHNLTYNTVLHFIINIQIDCFPIRSEVSDLCDYNIEIMRYYYLSNLQNVLTYFCITVILTKTIALLSIHHHCRATLISQLFLVLVTLVKDPIVKCVSSLLNCEQLALRLRCTS